MAVNFLLFLWAANNFEYKKVAKPKAVPKARRPGQLSWERPQVVEGVRIPGSEGSDSISRAYSIPPEEDVGVYGRSLAYDPTASMLAAPLR